MQLTFADLIAQLPPNTLYIAEDNLGNLGYNISVSALLGETVSTESSTQVIKLFSRLLNAGYKAQVARNQTATAENPLATFEPGSGSQIDEEGYIVQSQTFKVRLLASSATEIEGYQAPAATSIVS